ncbi:arsenate reductase ArsC [Spirosoma endbachense]|uniref:Arsenate reductase ArsC n=1 Tax=Spirosoma endbachense TaxID=2666025 RepID=A0A6P1VR73_9BACT|nr:arsenate reductase ArsC [Spirosoma endbachense]QHV94612.1 arsenate reductase ArsC [Spirosoma endbachense]
MKRILVLCSGNSARSQIAQAYLHYFADRLKPTEPIEVYSAGINPKGVNPLAIQVLAEDGIDIANHTSNPVEDYLHIPFDFVLTVCDKAREQCPFFPAVGQRIHQSFPEPSHMKGRDIDAEAKLTAFREVRDMIKIYSQEFIATHVGANQLASTQ